MLSVEHSGKLSFSRFLLCRKNPQHKLEYKHSAPPGETRCSVVAQSVCGENPQNPVVDPESLDQNASSYSERKRCICSSPGIALHPCSCGAGGLALRCGKEGCWDPADVRSPFQTLCGGSELGWAGPATAAVGAVLCV